MVNLALHSAEEPDNLRVTTGTVEVPTKRDNDVALAPGARPSQQHEPAARHSTPARKERTNEPFRGPTCVAMRNFVQIGQSVAEIWSFFDFSRLNLEGTKLGRSIETLKALYESRHT